MTWTHCEAMEHAVRLCARLASGVAEVVIAGSLRREKMEVKDIELVVRLLDDRPPHIAAHCLESRLLTLLNEGVLAPDPLVKRNGQKYKRFILPKTGERQTRRTGVHVVGALPVDLFIAETANFGCILTIRTGDSDFSRMLVTDRMRGGLMPDDLQQKDGYLWHIDRGRTDCPDEETYFRALGLPWIPPTERDINTAIAMRRERIAREGDLKIDT